MDLIVQGRSDQLAIVDSGIAITYGELNSRIQKFSSVLANLFEQKNQRIGVLIEHGAPALVAIFSILREGHCFVPLNPEFPFSRLEYTARDAELAALITTDKTRPLAEKLGSACEAASLISIETGEVTPPPGRMSLSVSQNLAYIIYTSGTTGQPKGVMISRDSLSEFLNWSNREFGFSSSDRVAGYSRLNFDLSILDVFCALTSGATYFPISNQEGKLFPWQHINKNDITVWVSVPSMIGIFSRNKQMLSGNFTSLRCGIFAGEALAYQDAVSWLTVFPEKELFNLYGPTEATVLCSHKKILLDEITRTKKVSIGKPNSVTPFYVLDEHMRLLPEGNSGRLFIGGRQVAQGYWNRTELSSERFVKDPFANDGSLMYDSGDIAVKDKDGDFYWISRADDQIKLYGYRIELGEIEAALSLYDKVAAVSVCFDKEKSELVTFFQKKESGSPILEKDLRRFCEQSLPKYMTPKVFIEVSEMPLNANGKIDKKELWRRYQESIIDPKHRT